MANRLLFNNRIFKITLFFVHLLVQVIFKSKYFFVSLIVFCFASKTNYSKNCSHIYNTAYQNNIGFEENKGQYIKSNGENAENIFYKLQLGANSVFLTSGGIVFYLTKPIVDSINSQSPLTGLEKIQEEVFRVDIRPLNGVLTEENSVAENPLKHSKNYYLNYCPQGITEVKTFQKITFKNIYPNIDWVFSYDEKKGLEHDFIVHKGGNTKNIQLAYIGCDVILEEGNNAQKLKIKTPINEITEGALYSYINSSKEKIASTFITQKSLHKKHETLVSFNIEPYNSNETVIIDPPLQMLWHTYFGTTSREVIRDAETDKDDNLYITGSTAEHIDFPYKDPSNGAYYQTTTRTYRENSMVFLSKFDNNGVLLWSTLYGAYDNYIPNSGGGGSFASAMTISDDNHVFIVGQTGSSSFPCYRSSSQYLDSTKATPSNHITSDAFILEFDSLGKRKWATLYGGTKTDAANDIDTDVYGNVYIIGTTASSDLETVNANTTGGYFKSHINTPSTTMEWWDSFILRFNKTRELKWATYFGGEMHEMARSIEVDNCNSTFYIGLYAESEKSDLTITNPGNGAFVQPTILSNNRWPVAYIAQFDQNNVITWSTYFGGRGSTLLHSIKTDYLGNLYINGLSENSAIDFPIRNLAGAYNNPTRGGIGDCFIAKFNPEHSLTWSTFFGGTQGEYAPNVFSGYGMLAHDFETIDIDKCNNLYLIGTTFSTDIPLKNHNPGCFYQPTKTPPGTSNINDLADLFVAIFNPNDTLVYCSYFGSNKKDHQTVIKSNTRGDLYLFGEYNGSILNFQDVGSGAYFNTTQPTTDPNNGISAAFILKLESMGLACERIEYNHKDVTCFGDNNGSASATIINPSSASYSYSWQPISSTSSSISNLPPGTYTLSIAGISSYCPNHTFFINGPDSLIVSLIGQDSICLGDSLILTARAMGGNFNYLYNWGAGYSADSTYKYLPSGSMTFSLDVADAKNCSAIANITVVVSPRPTISVIEAVSICNGDSIIILATGGINYYWSPSTFLSSNSGSPVIAYPTNTTTYTVASDFGQNKACGSNKEVFIAVKSPPLNINFSENNAFFCSGNYYDLRAPLNDGDSIKWFKDGEDLALNDSSLRATEQGHYTVKAKNTCGSVSDSIFIEEKNCSSLLFVPNAFVVSGNRNNSVFMAQSSLNNFERFEFSIFNRWGQLIFFSNDISRGWDGKYKDIYCKEDVYIYKINYSIEGNNGQQRGFVSLIK